MKTLLWEARMYMAETMVYLAVYIAPPSVLKRGLAEWLIAHLEKEIIQFQEDSKS